MLSKLVSLNASRVSGTRNDLGLKWYSWRWANEQLSDSKMVMY
jgi:hypothetical protein